MSLVKTYRSVVQIAAQEIDRRSRAQGHSGNAYAELQKIEDDRKKIGEQSHDKEPDQFQKDWIISINDFWMKYGEKLQPILQMSDVYIGAEASRGNIDCKAYKNRFT